MTQTKMQPLEILAALGINGMPTVIPVQGGFDMVMWKVEYEGQTYALRVFQPGRHEDCERERVVMAAARAAGLPVPEVHAAGVWQDHRALLITWLAGRMVADELRARPWHVWRLGIEFGRMQAAIHAVPAPDLLIGWHTQPTRDHDLRHMKKNPSRNEPLDVVSETNTRPIQRHGEPCDKANFLLAHRAIQWPRSMAFVVHETLSSQSTW